MDKAIFKQRRARLIELIKKTIPDKSGSIFLWANGTDQRPFVQEASFYYFTGINEPGSVLQLELDGVARLFVPNTQGRRAQWLQETFDTTSESVTRAGIDEIVYLGEPVSGYQLAPLYNEPEVKNLIHTLHNILKAGNTVFTCVPCGFTYTQQYLILSHLVSFVPQLWTSLTDISFAVTALRRKKEQPELELIFQAVQATTAAHFEVMSAIEAGVDERMLQAHLAATFAMLGVEHAFAPMVAAGRNSCWPHYELTTGTVREGDLVVVDCGAQCEHYCGDLTRTYPANGSFSKKQHELYEAVLECQYLLSTLAKPGMYLHNKENQELSLYYHMVEFFKKRGYQEFIVHGIGHFLGLEVHDVGSSVEPLQDGDVITIEPGLYLPKDGFGIRIEDDYLVVADGVYCLSQELPKKAADLKKIWEEKAHECDNCCHHTHHD